MCIERRRALRGGSVATHLHGWPTSASTGVTRSAAAASRRTWRLGLRRIESIGLGPRKAGTRIRHPLGTRALAHRGTQGKGGTYGHREGERAVPRDRCRRATSRRGARGSELRSGAMSLHSRSTYIYMYHDMYTKTHMHAHTHTRTHPRTHPRSRREAVAKRWFQLE